MSFVARVIGNTVVFACFAVGACMMASEVIGWYLDSRRPSRAVVDQD